MEAITTGIDTTFHKGILPLQDTAKGIEHIAILILFVAPSTGSTQFLTRAKHARFVLLATFIVYDGNNILKGKGFWTYDDPHKQAEEGFAAVSDLTIFLLFLDGIGLMDLGKYKFAVEYVCDATWVGAQVFHYKTEDEYELNAAIDVALAIATVFKGHPLIVSTLGLLAVATSRTFHLVGGPDATP